MQLLRYSGIALLGAVVVGLACQPVIIQQDDDDGMATTTTGLPSTTTGVDPTTTNDDSMEETTADPSADGTTTTGDTDSASESSSGDPPPDCNVGQACGNGCIEGTEQCDCGGEFCSPAGLGGSMCAGLVNPLFPDRVYTGGVLDCNAASCQFDFGMCTFCGDTLINGNEICELDSDPGPSCQQLGMGTSNTPLPCGLDCQWDTNCCQVPLPKECM